jgi:actin-like ATPase involved in cell morphogenesis
MADKDIFKERERSLEEEYFRRHEAKLLEKLRERGRLEEIAEALAVKLQVDQPELLRRIMALGVTLDTGAAFLLAPLVQIAWAEGKVSDRERETVLRIAGERGIEKTSPAYAQLVQWLRARPADELFDAAVEAIKAGLSVLPPEERADRVKRITEACREVAGASGGLSRLLGLGTGVSGEEESLLDRIAATLRSR